MNPYILHPSPNCNSREGHHVDMLVLHYTGMRSGANALDRMCDITAEVSAHYMVEENGRIFQLVDESMRAWHAGKSYWRGHRNINQRSIGIELVNPGHEFGYRPFPDVQMQCVIALCRDILSRHAIPARNIVGHSDVAPTRKQDPGELFDWKRLAMEGVGVWPRQRSVAGDQSLDSNTEYCAPITGLSSYGYDTTDLPAAITAFQRHFRPASITGRWDAECDMRLTALLQSTCPTA